MRGEKAPPREALRRADVHEVVRPADAVGGVRVYENGQARGNATEEDSRRRGLTPIDLSDTWTPFMLRDGTIATNAEGEAEGGPQFYRERYLAIANDTMSDDSEWTQAKIDRYFELYGIFPTLNVIRARMTDDTRHRCHDAIDNRPLASYSGEFRPFRRPRATEGEDTPRRRRAPTPEEEARKAAMLVVQGHLACEGLLPEERVTGTYEWRTIEALRIYQRKYMILEREYFDDESKAAILAGSRELDFRTLLRALRERVVDATGLIEDGSTVGETGEVLGRQLDTRELRASAQLGRLPNGARDLISRATEVAATQLGWTDPAKAKAWLTSLGEGGTRALEVAVRLPALPAYHSARMDLRAVVDRGDVYYDRPRNLDVPPRRPEGSRRPTITLYARHQGQEIALVRWNTTIGGWKKKAGGGAEYQESPVGERVWRQVVATPSWLFPESTPVTDLFIKRGGRNRLQRELFNPGYRNAYGLVMLMHDKPITRDGQPAFRDEGVRTHGSLSYRSILSGESHGCHRLFNHYAVRLADFVLRHRTFERRGSQAVNFRQRVRGHDVTIDTRGYLYELTPPMPIEVTLGTEHGRRPRGVSPPQG